MLVSRSLVQGALLGVTWLFPAAGWAQASATEQAPSAAGAGADAAGAKQDDCPEHDATLCGRRRFEAGTVAFEHGDYQTAVVEFRAAIAQRSHPVIRFNLGVSLARLGQPRAALEELRLVVADPLSDKGLKERAERESRSAEQALARVTFQLSDPRRERVELDGQELPGGAAGELELDPGAHHVRVISGSSVVLDQELELAPGERVELRVGERSRRIDVVVVPPGQAQAQPPAPAPPPDVPRPLSPLWFYAAAGTTAVLTGVTIWSALDTQGALNDYERDLPNLTQAQADGRVADGHSRELRTNLLLLSSVVAGAGTAALGLFFVDFGGGQQARLAVAPGRLTLDARF